MLSRKFLALAGSSVLVHAFLFATSGMYGRVAPFTDVLLYGWWLFEMQGGPILGVSADWVYPYPALIPIFVATALGGGVNILLGWVIMMAILNTLLIGQITDWGRGQSKAFVAAWFWLGFLFLLGPVAIGRIDAVATAIAGFGLVAFSNGKIRQAVTFFTLGAWVKIWPIATALGLFLSSNLKKNLLLTASIAVSAVLALGLLLGGDLSLLSFVSTQGNRGIQIESPIATIWLWAAKLGTVGAGIYFDDVLLTNQVSGPGVAEVAALMTPAMAVAIAITALLGWRAARAGADSNQVFAIVSLTAVLDLIVFNKVGSPQFIGWLAVPIIAVIIFQLHGWRVAMVGGLGLAALTYLIYPLYYLDLMGLGWLSISLLTVRNLGLILLLVWANLKLGSLAKPQVVR